ncbi:hypothetical protein FRB98_001785 [Tulasnella sp. 332]|nr:hypothetical protein FRB98_001785 [Tulasnella sp. 332]
MLDLDHYDPFAASSSTSSFLPSRGLFSPISPPRTQQPVYCTTIIEEEDSEEEEIMSRPTKTSSGSSCATIQPFRTERQASAISINPRVLRSDSCTSDDDEMEIPSVLRFPVPPASLPTPAAPSPSPPPPIPTRSSARPSSSNRPAQITIPPPRPQPTPTHLKSCFEDDSPNSPDQLFSLPSMTTIISRTNSRRTSAVIGASPSLKSAPTTPMTPMTPPTRPSSGAPLSLLRRATNAMKSPGRSQTQPLAPSSWHSLSPAALKLPESPPTSERPSIERPSISLPAAKPQPQPSQPRHNQKQNLRVVSGLITLVDRHHEPASLSPTPSLTSSASSYSEATGSAGSGRSSWIGMGYIPVGTIMEADSTPVKDLDDYLETFERYFPSNVWDPVSPVPPTTPAPAPTSTPARKATANVDVPVVGGGRTSEGGASGLKRSSSVRGHSRTRSGGRSADSGVLSRNASTTTPPSSSPESRRAHLLSSSNMSTTPPRTSSPNRMTHSRSRNHSVDSALSMHSRSRTSSGGSLNRMSVVVGQSGGSSIVLGHPSLSRSPSSVTTAESQIQALKRSVSSSFSGSTRITQAQALAAGPPYRRPAMMTTTATTTAAITSPPPTPLSPPTPKAPKSILKPSRSQPNLNRNNSTSSIRNGTTPPPVPTIPAMYTPPSTPPTASSSPSSSSSRYRSAMASPMSPNAPSFMTLASSTTSNSTSRRTSGESVRHGGLPMMMRSAMPLDLLIRQRAAPSYSL